MDQGNEGRSLSYCFHGEEPRRQGRQFWDWLIALPPQDLDFHALWSSLASGLRVIGQLDSGLECEEHTRLVTGDVTLRAGHLLCLETGQQWPKRQPIENRRHGQAIQLLKSRGASLL